MGEKVGELDLSWSLVGVSWLLLRSLLLAWAEGPGEEAQSPKGRSAGSEENPHDARTRRRASET